MMFLHILSNFIEIKTPNLVAIFEYDYNCFNVILSKTQLHQISVDFLAFGFIEWLNHSVLNF
jgi:hypothetical protein